MFDIPFNHAAFAMPKRARMPVTRRRASCLRDPSCRNHKKSLSRVSGGWNSPLGPADTSVSSFARLGFWLEQDANSDHRKSGSCDWSIVIGDRIRCHPDQQEHSLCRGRVTLVLTHV